eukprot:scaffold82747_cov28-Tisochrysis_lutea.AAC.3
MRQRALRERSSSAGACANGRRPECVGGMPWAVGAYANAPAHLRDKRLECLRGSLSATLGRLALEHLLAHPFDFEGRRHKELLRAERIAARGPNVCRDLCEQPRCLGVLVGLAIQLDRLEELARFDQLACILRKSLVDGGKVMLFGHLDGPLEVLQHEARVDCQTDITALYKGVTRLVCHAHRAKLATYLFQQRCAVGQVGCKLY